MPRRWTYGLIGLILILLVVGLFFTYNGRDHAHELLLYGNVDVREVDIGFRVSGRVEKLCFEEGDLVCQGDLMATLESSPYESQKEQAEAQMLAAKVSYENAEKQWKRREELIGIGGVSKEDLENAEASLKQLKATLLQYTAAFDVASYNVDYTKVSAPTDGVILTRVREPGSVVRESEPVYTLSITSPVWIRAFVSEENLGKIYYGMEAMIYTDTEGKGPYKGKIGFISPVAEFTPKTVETTQLRTDLVYRLRIYAENPDRFLKQGMPVTVKLHDLR